MAGEIRYDRRALANLRHIHDTIAGHNPQAARRVISTLRASIGYLADNPPHATLAAAFAIICPG